MKFKKLLSGILGASLLVASFAVPYNTGINISVPYNANAVSISEMPSEYQYAADWIWQNRIEKEQSTARWNTIFDQIIAGKGTINYVVRWQSYKTITLEQRKQLETMLEKCYNDWNKWLAGYENWPYEHIDVNIVGWAVLDKNLLLDLQPDEVVYDNLIEDYDSTYDTSNGVETIPDKLSSAPSELSRFDHFTDKSYEYPGGLDKRFDMYLWATQGFPSIGGCGGDWGQRLSDDAYINMLDGTGIHVLEHEVGHGFGMTDFYGGEGESDGFPPGGFPNGGTSIMMAGSSMEITDFDGWFFRYMWSKLKDESGRFDLSEPVQPTTETTTATTTVTTTETTTTSIPVIPSESIEFFRTDENKWTFNANNAHYAELTFSGSPYGGISGNLNGTAWDLRFEESDTASIKLELPENTYESVIEKIYSGVWSNEIGDMIDMPSELISIKLYYDDTTTTTTTTTSGTTTQTEPNNIVFGDVNGDGNVTIADAVAAAAYIGNPENNYLNEKALKAADVHGNGDGVSANDALAIQQYIAKIIEKLPV